jgi:4-amino-4-deoxy-L-arabinose transferase-like glycosyltransferase
MIGFASPKGIILETPARAGPLRRWLLAGLLLISLFIHLSGLRQELPYIAMIDEPSFLIPAAKIATTGDLNPGWFGHPGSTVIYPLAGIFKIYQRWFGVNLQPALQYSPNSWIFYLQADSWKLYLTGRILVALYSVFALVWIYMLGKKVFGTFEALLGIGFYSLYLIVVSHGQVIRTDAAATFWCMLSLWRIVEVYERPSWFNQWIAGACIGLSISSRYFMVTLVPVLFAVDVLLVMRCKESCKRIWLPAIFGLASAPIFFAISTPYFVLAFNDAFSGLIAQNSSRHTGADGLSPLQNLWWYVRFAIPKSITWAQYFFASLGAVIVLYRKQLLPIVLLGYVAIFLAGISLSNLHWQRWIIQILPILALFAAHGLRTSISWLSARFKWSHRLNQAALCFAMIALAARPAYDLVLHNIQANTTTTRFLARQWMIDHLPPESKIAIEAYSAPLANSGFEYIEVFSLRDSKPLEQYYPEGYRYLVISSSVYGRYRAEPERYPEHIQFYEQLAKQGRLLYIIEPTLFHGGPVIQIYKLRPQLLSEG